MLLIHQVTCRLFLQNKYHAYKKIPYIILYKLLKGTVVEINKYINNRFNARKKTEDPHF